MLHIRFSAILIVLILLTGCGSTYQLKKEFIKSSNESSSFKGFVLYNPIAKKDIINHNGAKYFTPASNTKLFTFYTAFKTLKDSVKSLAYFKTKDSLMIKGTADPSLLYFGKDSTKVIEFLKGELDSIYLLDNRIDETPYGSGWAWDDYQENYMPEKSLFPIFGNIVQISAIGDSIISSPTYFDKDILLLDSVSLKRKTFQNKFYQERNNEETNLIPFKVSNNIVADLLGQAISTKIKLIPSKKEYNFSFLYGLNYNELFKQMLVESDNFIAEQLMLQVGKEVADSYSVEVAIEYALNNYLKGIPQPPRWVDGSGLSRYNLFSPNDMIFLLEKMHNEIPLQKLLDYFPVGGQSGTFKKNWYAIEKPFVYAKSGSLSNNYNLSGYLITKKGTLLIFSSMNNHYRIPTSEVKESIEKFLIKIYNTY